MDSKSMQTFMGWFKWVLVGVMVIALALIVLFSLLDFKKRKIKMSKFIAVTGMFAALSSILYCVKIFTFHLPFLPSFLSIHLDEIPIFIVGYAYGPLAAIMVTLVKTIIKLPMSTTACVGEFGDLFLTLIFVLPSVILYTKRRKLSSVFIGFGVSFFVQIVSAMFLNVYAFIPFYEFLWGISEEQLLAACQAANPNITDVGWSYALLAVLPMNAIKNSIVLVITFFIYKALHKYLRLSWKKEKEVVEEQ